MSITTEPEKVKGIPCSFSDAYRRSIHSPEGLTQEDKRLFLGARLRLLYRKLAHRSPVSRDELSELAAYAYGGDADDPGAVT